MSKNDESFSDRLRKFTLAHWGLFCILAAVASGFVSKQIPAKNQAELAGRSAGVFLFVIVGVVLIIVHFVRRGLSGKAKKTVSRKTAGNSKRKPKRPN